MNGVKWQAGLGRTSAVTAGILILLWTCTPSSINLAASITIEDTQFRFNSLLTIAALVPLGLGLASHRAETPRIGGSYHLFVLGTLSTFFLSTPSNFHRVWPAYFEAVLILLAPFLIFRVYCVLDDANRRIVWRAAYLSGAIAIAQVLVRGVSASWQSDAAEGAFRATTTVGASTVSALYICVVGVIALCEFERTRRWVFVVFAGACLLADIFLLTRSAIVIWTVVIVLNLLRIRIRRIAGTVIGMAAVGTLIQVAAPQLFDAVYLRFGAATSAESNAVRQEVLSEGAQFVQEHLLFGGGLGQIIDTVARVGGGTSVLRNPHNQWMAIAIEAGFVGLILFGAFVLTALVRALKFVGLRPQLLLFLAVISVAFFAEVIIMKDLRTVLIFWLPLLYLQPPLEAGKRAQVGGALVTDGRAGDVNDR